jgi:hypothetical protein
MTQRQEVRFKVYTKTRYIRSGQNIFPLELIDFIQGDGTYDTTTYTYTVQNAGTYFLGFSCNSESDNKNSAHMIFLERIVDGVSTTRVINRGLKTFRSPNCSLNSCFMYKLEVDDKLYIREWYGRSLTVISSYTSDDTLNSFWGIRLDY